MELVVEPDIYSPSIGENGIYVDKTPCFNIIKKGVVCPCGSRKDQTYDKTSAFTAHIKTKIHQKWLESMNKNRENFYVELEKAKDVISNQRLIIAKLEKDVNDKHLTINYLTQQLYKMNTTPITIDLLDM
jgi:hypothetical protein